jgi:3-keto-L-gulonate-6-phosphate decarboxylase
MYMVLGTTGDEELAVKQLNGVRERLGVVAVGGGSKSPGVQLVLGVGASLVVVGSCVKLQQ